MNKYYTLQTMLDQKLAVVVRGNSVDSALKTAHACIEGGIHTIEVTFTVPGAEQVIRTLVEENRALIGAGAILDVQTARIAILAGAMFIVSPAFDTETASLCNLYKVPYLPGCMTINDVTNVLRAGTDIVKLFPGQMYDPSFIKAIKGPIPQVDVMPTGGVTLHNMNEWLQAGASMVGVGGEITRPASQGNYEEVRENAAAFVAQLKHQVVL